MLAKIVYTTLFILLSIVSVTSAATWWDAKNVHRTEDGCIEYSLYVNDYLNKDNGDVFTGVIIQKYGSFSPYKFSKYTNNINKSSGMVQNSVIALSGTINGNDISNIPIYVDEEIKYIDHRKDEKCKRYAICKGEKK